VLLALLLPHPALSAITATAERLDGTQITGTWMGVGDGGEIVLQVDGREQKFAADEIREITLNGAAVASPLVGGAAQPSFVLELADGGRIPLTAIKGGSGDSIAVETSLSPELTVSFKHLAAIRVGWLADNAEAARLFEAEFAQRQPGKDVLIAAANGAVRSVRGTLVGLDFQAGQFNFGGTVRTFRLDDLFAVVFARGAAEPPRAPTELRLVDGAVLRGRLAKSGGEQLVVNTSFGATLTVPLERVQSVGLASGRAVLLSELAPARTNTEGLLHAPWPIRKDRSVSNSAVSLDGRQFAHGLGVHSRTELMYELDGSFERLVGVIGIDDAVRPLGNVVFKVLGDGRTLFDSGPVTGADASRPINVDITGVKQLTLLVDYGEQMDLSDHADWADLRLIHPPAGARRRN
jgi:hypothetical protein